MFFIRFFVCFILICGGQAAFAVSPWGSADPAAPRKAIKGVWGTESKISENNKQDAFDVAGLFFDGEEETDEEIPLPPWLEHAVAIPDVDESSPMIAIVIDDLGVNRKMTKEVLDLPAPLTASFCIMPTICPTRHKRPEPPDMNCWSIRRWNPSMPNSTPAPALCEQECRRKK